MSGKQAHWFYGDLVIVHVDGEQTGGRFTLLEWLQPAGEWTPLHVHRSADQTMFVLDGELTTYAGDSKTVAGPGESAHLPLGVPHTEFVSSAGSVRLIEVVAPAGFERFVAAAGEPATELTLPPADGPEPDLNGLAALAAELADVELLGPPGALPGT
jgi:quercetin dioxygenase-like cupin family protein